MALDRERVEDELTQRFLDAVPHQFGMIPTDRIVAIHTHYDFAIFLPVRFDAYLRAMKTQMQRRKFRRRKEIGYRGFLFNAYWWTVEKAISFGVSVHVHDPVNVELHLPFGFIRIGLTSRADREAQYEDWLCGYIIKHYEEQEADTWAKQEIGKSAYQPKLPRAETFPMRTKKSSRDPSSGSD